MTETVMTGTGVAPYKKLLVVALITATVSLMLICISFSTNYWVIYSAPQPMVTTDAGFAQHPELYYTRNRGMFKTCYAGSSAWMLTDPRVANIVIDGNCVVEQGYEINNYNAILAKYSNNYYDIHIHLMRVHWSMFIIAIGGLVVANALTLYGICSDIVRAIRLAGIFCIAAAIAAELGMTIFHCYYYVENNLLNVNITLAPYYAYTNPSGLYPALATTPGQGIFGYSFYLGWFGAIFTLVAAIILLLVTRAMQKGSFPQLHFPELHLPPMPKLSDLSINLHKPAPAAAPAPVAAPAPPAPADPAPPPMYPPYYPDPYYGRFMGYPPTMPRPMYAPMPLRPTFAMRPPTLAPFTAGAIPYGY